MTTSETSGRGGAGTERKPRLTVEERAARYVAKLDGAVKGQSGHQTGFYVACVLVQGFALSPAAAEGIFRDYNTRCAPPFSEEDLRRKLTSAEKAAGLQTKQGLRPRGCLRDSGNFDRGTDPAQIIETDAAGRRVEPRERAPEQINRPGFDAQKLKDMAGAWSGTVDLVWLANRSTLDPAQVTASGFLQALYPAGEKVVIFSVYKSQGQAIWPADKVPTEGAEGVWFLAQPVDGKAHPNPRSLDAKTGQPKMSRRSEESVTAFRYIVLESDVSDMRDWLGLLVQLPLRIEAIYTSGGRSIHALMRVDCATRGAWDEERKALAPVLNLLHIGGNDAGALSCVRLTRLPGALRLGKTDDAGVYRRFEQPKLQKLLYLRPGAPVRAIKDLAPVRDVEGMWCGVAATGIAESDDGSGQRWIEGGLGYYANVSARVRAARDEFRAGLVRRGMAESV